MSGLSQLVKPIAHRLDLVTLPLHIHHVIAAFLLYEFIFDVAAPLLSPLVAPNAYGRLDRRGRINWHAHVVSMVQCLVINAAAFQVIFTDPDRTKARDDWRERLWGYTPMAGRVQGFAAGYFLWDTVVSIGHMDVMGPSSLFHAVAALGITCLGFRPFANYYGINFVLYELSTPFLNVHWFLDKFGLTGSNAQLINGILLILSFAGSRLVWGVYQSYLIYNDVWLAWNSQSAFSDSCAKFFHATKLYALLDVPNNCRTLPTWLGVLYVGANSALTVLNVFWFTKMISAVTKRFSKPETDKKNS